MKRITGILCVFLILSTVCFADYPFYVETHMPECDRSLQEVSVIGVDSGAMLINGAIRYIDDDDLSVTPLLEDAKTYLPASAAAQVFHAYLEENPRIGQVDFRYDASTWSEELHDSVDVKHRLVVRGASVVMDGQSSDNNIVIYKNAKCYLSVRALAQWLGKTVSYHRGYIVIGERSFVDELVNHEEYFAYAISKLIPFSIPVFKGNTYIVSPEGTENGLGTLDSPMTLSKACNLAQAGDTVLLRGGTYREVLAPKNSGTARNPIRYCAYPDEKPVLNATDVLSGFQIADGIASVACDIDLGLGRNQLFYQGECVPEARYPNRQPDDYDIDDLSNLYAPKGNIRVQPDANTAILTAQAPIIGETNRWKGGILVSLHGTSYTFSTGVITSSVVNSENPNQELLIIDENLRSGRFWPSVSEGAQGYYGYISGVEAAMDLSGEWVLQDGILKMIPPDGNSNEFSVEMKARQLCADLSGTKFIHLDGIQMFGGSITMRDSYMNIIKRCQIKYGNHYTFTYDSEDGNIDSADLWKARYEEDVARLRGEVGVYIGGENDVIRDCVFDTAANAAICLTGLYTAVWNNNIKNCGYMSSFIGGIHIDFDARKGQYAPCGGHDIRFNTVRNSSRSALTQHSVNEWISSDEQPIFIPMEISYNHFVNGGINSNDTGILYFCGATLGNGYRNTKLRNNMIYSDCTPVTPYIGMIYFDARSQGVDCYNNLIFRTKNSIDFMRAVYIQNIQSVMGTAQAIINSWDNTDFGVFYRGVIDVYSDNYPDRLPFLTGFRSEMQER